MQYQQLIPHLFRAEFSKISAVLCRLLGIEHIEVAEDIAGETFLTALETWPYRGIPANPKAWLYTVAGNKARNYLRRDKVFTEKILPAIKPGISADIEIDFSDEHITDSLLQMLFAVCHPAISTEAQIGLALRILCGFGIDEIATAFLTSKETINKRLFRAKEKLREEKVQIAFPEPAVTDKRLAAVLATLYLLFSEGYYSENREVVIREELCNEAMRLNLLLINNTRTDLPDVNALYALMCFHASRFPARKDNGGQMILYHQQDETLWNRELIAQGAYYLNKASRGTVLSKYHLEAGIAYWYTVKPDTQEKWESVLKLYNILLQVEYSPVTALNSIYAISKVHGKQQAIAEAEQLNLPDNHFYHMLLGELYTGINNHTAKEHFARALSLAKNVLEKQTIRKRIEYLTVDRKA